MKKTYKIDVDCANCANKMEEAAKNTAGVKDATVNFMTLKMIVEFEDGQEPKAVMQEVLKNCKKVDIAGMIFQTGSRHRVNSKTITGLDVLCSVTQMN